MATMTGPHLRHALLGEFLGTALLVLLGDGVVASVVLLGKQADWIVITTGWALAVTLGVYVSGRLSGGHPNPAGTLAPAARGGFPPPPLAPPRAGPFTRARAGGVPLSVAFAPALPALQREHGVTRVAPYWAAQLTGACAAAVLLYVDYAEAFRAFEREHGITRGAMAGGKLAGPRAGGAGVFATFPAFDDPARNLLSEFLGTAVLL